MAGKSDLSWQAHLWSSSHRQKLGSQCCPLLPKVRVPSLGPSAGKWCRRESLGREERREGYTAAMSFQAVFWDSLLPAGVLCAAALILNGVLHLDYIPAYHLTLSSASLGLLLEGFSPWGSPLPFSETQLISVPIVVICTLLLNS